MENKKEVFVYTEEQLMARLKFFIGICLALTLTGIVFVVLYSLIFVTQPLNAISPIDQKFFELIVPIATFLTGTLSGIMLAGNDKDARMKALEAANKPPPPSSTPSGDGMGPRSIGGMGMGSSMTGSRMEPSFGMGGMGMGMPTPVAADRNADYGSVTMGFGGKLAPPPAPQPEI